MSTPFRAIVGLGNPGKKYEDTRHNAGFWLVDHVARKRGASFRNEHRFFGEMAEFGVGKDRVRLLKPTTFMNNSGQAVAALMRYYGLSAGELLIAHDEIDLPPGTTRLKMGGGHGGHNGLRDILTRLPGKEFARARIGVGHPGTKEQVIGYVLSRARNEERAAIEESMLPLLDGLDDLLCGHMQRVMNVLHRRAG